MMFFLSRVLNIRQPVKFVNAVYIYTYDVYTHIYEKIVRCSDTFNNIYIYMCVCDYVLYIYIYS